MFGSRRKRTCSRNRRPLLKPNLTILLQHFRKAWAPFVLGACLWFPDLASAQQARGPAEVTLDQAIQLATQHNHSLLANRTLVLQNQAQEITANLRPNPTLFTDWEYLPLP